MTTTPPQSRFPGFADPALAPFWDGARAGKLVMQGCKSCNTLRWPPAMHCPECLSEETEWREAAPTGSLISYCTYHRAMSASSKGEVPYSMAYVVLDDGPRMYGRLLPNAAGAKCDARVRAVFHEIEPGVTFVGWELDKG